MRTIAARRPRLWLFISDSGRYAQAAWSLELPVELPLTVASPRSVLRSAVCRKEILSSLRRLLGRRCLPIAAHTFALWRWSLNHRLGNRSQGITFALPSAWEAGC